LLSDVITETPEIGHTRWPSGSHELRTGREKIAPGTPPLPAFQLYSTGDTVFRQGSVAVLSGLVTVVMPTVLETIDEYSLMRLQ
jgi:hypothetical protein